MDKENSLVSPLYTGLRIFSRIVLLLMVIGMLYGAWLALIYWPEIRV